MEIKILAAVYDPHLKETGEFLRKKMGWGDPKTIGMGLISDLGILAKDLSITFSVRFEQVYKFPRKVSGFQYTAETFLQDWEREMSLTKTPRENIVADSGFWMPPDVSPGLTRKTSVMNNDWADYNSIIQDFNILGRLSLGEIDEVWVFAPPYAGLYESRMMGWRSFWCNGPRIFSLSKLAVLMGFNYERGNAEALHAFGHRAESILTYYFRRWENLRDPSQWNYWEKYTALNKDRKNWGGLGNVHYPVNGQFDYDYNNPLIVKSSWADWKNYPNFSNTLFPASCHNWECDQRQYLRWWFSYMPQQWRGMILLPNQVPFRLLLRQLQEAPSEKTCLDSLKSNTEGR